jgi:adenylate kinase family enzyme
VRRVSVVGAPGSGKSTLAGELASRLAVPHVELDAIYHQPGWVPVAAAEFSRRVAAAAAGDGWVIDGNYSSVQPLIWGRADTVVWLDLPRRTVMRRLAWRTFRRVASRAELWNGNRERWRNLLTRDPQQSVIAYAWQHHPVYRQRYTGAAARAAENGPRFIRLTGGTDIRRLLDSLPPAPGHAG